MYPIAFGVSKRFFLPALRHLFLLSCRLSRRGDRRLSVYVPFLCVPLVLNGPLFDTVPAFRLSSLLWIGLCSPFRRDGWLSPLLISSSVVQEA